MDNCECWLHDREQLEARINAFSETLSQEFIMVMMTSIFCPAASELTAGKMLAAIAARIHLMTMPEGDVKKLEKVNLLDMPKTREILERIIAESRKLTEDHVART